MLADYALEHSRRVAWARFYKARADAQQMAYWAAEIGEHLARIGDLHPDVAELLDLTYAALPDGARLAVRRYVASRTQPQADWDEPEGPGSGDDRYSDMPAQERAAS